MKGRYILFFAVILIAYIHWRERIKKRSPAQGASDYADLVSGGNAPTYDDGVHGKAKVIDDDALFYPFSCENGKSDPSSPDQLPEGMYYNQNLDGMDAIIWMDGVDAYVINPCKREQANEILGKTDLI